jgi:nematocidal protein AidA
MNEKDMLQGSTAVTISILFVVNTDPIINYYTKAGIAPSTVSTAPTQLPNLDSIKGSLRMICDSPRGITSGQGSYDLNFKAYKNDQVQFAGTSIEANSDSAVIVYGLTRRSGDNVFDEEGFKQDFVVRNKAVVPSSGSGVPPALKAINFATFKNTVKWPGTESYDLKFALYNLKEGEEQVLYGYFVWDPTITVS